MSGFVTYQCNICKESKDFLKDSQRVLPNNCVLTVGCQGRLFSIGEKVSSDNYFTAQEIEIQQAETSPPVLLFSFLNSTYPLLSIAVKSDQSLPSKIKVKVKQQKVENMEYEQYVFKLQSTSNKIPEIVNGVPKKDINGKSLTFSLADIEGGKVFISVNGVSKFIGDSEADILSILPGEITFNSSLTAGSNITVAVYKEQKIIDNELVFYKNSFRTLIYGAWSDVDKLYSYFGNQDSLVSEWTVYSCDFFQNFSGNSRLRIDSILAEDNSVIKSNSQLNDVLFLLSHYPFRRYDKHTNFIVIGSDLAYEFALNMSNISTVVQITAENEKLTEVYPALFVPPSGYIENYIEAEINRESLDGLTIVNNFKGKKTIGA